MSEMTSRFREVRVTLDREASPLSQPPDYWLNIRAVGNVLTFVDCHFSGDRLTAEIGVFAGAVRDLDAKPMSLRAIFTALAAATRDTGKSGTTA